MLFSPKLKGDFKVKGAPLISKQMFVKENFPDRFDEWINNLSEASQRIYKNVIYPGEWYDAYPAIIPTTMIGKMFFNGDVSKAYYEIGVYSAKRTLFGGIYKDLLDNITRDELIELFRHLLTMYFNFGETRIRNFGKNKVKLFWFGFPHFMIPNFARFRGYIEQVVTVLDCKTYVSHKVIKKRNSASVVFYFKFEK